MKAVPFRQRSIITLPNYVDRSVWSADERRVQGITSQHEKQRNQRAEHHRRYGYRVPDRPVSERAGQHTPFYTLNGHSSLATPQLRARKKNSVQATLVNTRKTMTQFSTPSGDRARKVTTHNDTRAPCPTAP